MDQNWIWYRSECLIVAIVPLWHNHFCPPPLSANLITRSKFVVRFSRDLFSARESFFDAEVDVSEQLSCKTGFAGRVTRTPPFLHVTHSFLVCYGQFGGSVALWAEHLPGVRVFVVFERNCMPHPESAPLSPMQYGRLDMERQVPLDLWTDGSHAMGICKWAVCPVCSPDELSYWLQRAFLKCDMKQCRLLLILIAMHGYSALHRVSYLEDRV